jgi:hypothetical protein
LVGQFGAIHNDSITRSQGNPALSLVSFTGGARAAITRRLLTPTFGIRSDID